MRTPEPTSPTSRQNLPPAEIGNKAIAFAAGVDKPKYETNRKKEQREGETGESTWIIVSVILMKAHMMMYFKQTQHVRTTPQLRHPEV
jgi:hypothetical protein